MEQLSQHLLDEYHRTLRQLPNDCFEREQISYQEVVKAHYLICDYFEAESGHQSFSGVKDYNMLCSAVCRQQTQFGGRQKWVGKYEMMATLFFGLVRNHAFHDGNKRTALLVLLSHLYKNHRFLTCKQHDLEQMTVAVAEGRWKFFVYYLDLMKKKDMSDTDAAVYSIAIFLRKHSRQLNKQYNPVTYLQFENAIKQFDFAFAHPSGNYIDIVKKVTKKPLFRRAKTEYQKVCQIGFPGFKRVMSVETIKDTLKKLKLTTENGFDKEVVFGEREPLFQLIHDYEGPLKRLQDR